MRTLHTDASFDWNHTNATAENVVKGKIAIHGEGLKMVERVAVGKVPALKQYINILELVAIARAIEMACQQGWRDDLNIITDSQVAMFWARSGKIKEKVRTDAHIHALEYLHRSKKLYPATVTFGHVKRDLNPAGFLLADELEKEPPHGKTL